MDTQRRRTWCASGEFRLLFRLPYSIASRLKVLALGSHEKSIRSRFRKGSLRVQRLSSLLIIVGLLGMACSSKDKTAPPPPRIDPIDSPTGLEKVTINGSAEYGATIVMSGAQAFEPAEVTADPFTAHFRVVATLKKNATSSLSFSAKDHAGNTSEPTIVKIEQEDGHGVASKLSLELYVNGSTTPASDPLTVAAGDTLRAQAEVKDAPGHVLDLPIAITTSIPNAFVAGPEITEIRSAGDFEVAATVAGSSLALSRQVKVTPGKASQISLDASPATVMAGSTIFVTAIAHDAFGNLVGDADIKLASVPALDSSYKPVCGSKALDQGFLDAHRFVAYDLSAVAGSGYVFELKATSGDASASASVTVHPGPAARFAPLDPKNCTKGDAFAFTDASWKSDAAEPINAAAGSSVYYRYSVIDSYGNPAVGPVSVVTTAPGANVIDDGISGVGQVAHLTTSGTFDLSAYIAGVSAPAVKSFSVNVGDAHSATVYLSSTLASPGDTVYAFASIHDAFGNTVACPSGAVSASTLDVVASPAATATGGAVTCSDGLFQRPFTFSGNGTYTLTATYKIGGTVSASSFVTILGIDATPPTVSIANIAIDGVACTPSGSPPSCAVTRGATVDFDVVANDNVALSEIEYSAFFQTIGSGFTRTVLVSGNTALPIVTHFHFTVSNRALPEQVPLVGLAVDSSGNRATSDQVFLQVDVIGTFGRTVQTVVSGGVVNAPTDIAFDPNGNMFIANDGATNLLEVAKGSITPVVFSSYNQNSRYIAVDHGGNVYLTNNTRIVKVDATGSNVTNYVNLTGNSAQGLALVGATAAKGTIDASGAADAATVAVAGQTFELDISNNGCTGGAGVVCVAVASSANKNQALATAIGASSSVNTMVGAVFDAGANKVVLAAATRGEAADAITLSAGTGVTVSGSTLSEGHDEELFVGQTADNNIYRFPETLSANSMVSSNHGQFGVAATQHGVAVKDMITASSPNLRDLYLYFVDGGNTNTLRGYHAVNGAAPASVFALTSSNMGGGQNFNTLYDVVLEPTSPAPASNPVNGCLLVSDQGSGRIYAVDTSNAANTSPAITLVANGFADPRGLAFYNGDLYVADRGNDAVMRLSPSPSTTDCF
jgi:hypothetical protein